MSLGLLLTLPISALAENAEKTPETMPEEVIDDTAPDMNAFDGMTVRTDETDLTIQTEATKTTIQTGNLDYFISESVGDEPPDCDLNGDGEITSGDLAFLKALVFGKIETAEEVKLKADINGDGEISSGDLAKLKALMLQNESSLG